MNLKNGITPLIEDVVRGHGLVRTGVIVAIVAAVGKDGKLTLLVQRQVPRKLLGTVFKSVVVFCPEGTTGTEPVIMVETILEYGWARDFELIVRHGKTPEMIQAEGEKQS